MGEPDRSVTGPPITFTLDLEDHRPDHPGPLRCVDVIPRVLDHLRERRIVGTFFVVGELAEAEPTMVKDIAAQGHEIALHGWDHTPLPKLTPDRLLDHAKRGRELLADLTGTDIRGFRAPVFSLTPDASWAPEVLAAAGFSYSSSVLPARSPLYGWPGAPREPFLWPSGLVELPSPVVGVGSVALPFLGGVYSRVLPRRAIGLAQKRLSTAAAWTYTHAHDFDADEPYWRMPEVGRLGSRLLWLNRRGMFDRIDAIVAPNPGPPLREVAEKVRPSAAEFDA